MAVDSLAASVEQIMQETLSPTILNLRRDIDPFIGDYVYPDDSVERDDTIGRDYKKRMIIELGLAGAVEYDDILGNNVLSDQNPTSGLGDNFTLYGEDVVSTWPNLNEMVTAGWVPIGFQLQKFKGNAAIPVDLLRAENLPATIGKPVAATIRGLARNVNLAMANTFWKEITDSGSTRVLDWICSTSGFWSGTVANPGEFTANDWIDRNGIYDSSASAYVAAQLCYDSSGTATRGSSGQIRKLYDGQRVDLYTVSGATATRQNAADQPVYVDNVNPLQETFHLKIKTGTKIALTASATWYLANRKSNASGRAASARATSGAMGLPDWIKSSGTLGTAVYGGSGLGSSALALTRVPQLRSYVAAAGSVKLTELLLMQYLARCTAALGNQWGIDTLVSTPGVWLGYIDELDTPVTMADQTTTAFTSPAYRLNRNLGEPYEIRGGLSKKMSIMYDGRTYVLETSPFCHDGTLWGLKTRDRNFKMYVVPRIRDTVTHELFSDAVEFMGPALGYSSIFIPVHQSATASVTNVRQMPFEMPHEFWPDMIPGMKITGISETIADPA